MSVIVPDQSYPIEGNDKFMLIVWSNLANGDEGAPFVLCQYADRSVQIEGTFGTGGAVEIQGSNNNTSYHTLTDTQGDLLSITSASVEQVMEIVKAIKPVVTGDGTTSLTISMLVRK